MDVSEMRDLGLHALAAIESASGAIMDQHKLAKDLLLQYYSMGTEIFDRTEIIKIKGKMGC